METKTYLRRSELESNISLANQKYPELKSGALATMMLKDGDGCGKDHETLSRYIRRFRAKGTLEGPRHVGQGGDSKQKKNEGLSVDESKNQLCISVESHQIKTVDDALKAAKVDNELWEVERYLINKYEVAAKDREQDLKFKKGVMTGYAIRRNKFLLQPLWQVKVWLKRRVPKAVSDGIDLLMKRIEKHAPKYDALPEIKPVSDPHLLEISLFDLHFGKLAWGQESGSDFDLKIAEKIYLNAVQDLMSKSKGFPVEQILFPLGQDFFHLDNARNMTVNDTPVDVDSRYPKIFEAGVLACIKAIDYLIQFSPVEVLWVPGNHDRTTSYHLVRELKAWYHNTSRVSIDCSPKVRKYKHYGRCLIGYTHGNEEGRNTLPSIMASECAQGWVDAVSREWHIGHHHKMNLVEFEVDGVPVGVRVLPSLTATDSWHFRKGFANQLRAASAFVWSKSRGYSGHFMHLLPETGKKA